jgi:hypothetical protein
LLEVKIYGKAWLLASKISGYCGDFPSTLRNAKPVGVGVVISISHVKGFIRFNAQKFHEKKILRLVHLLQASADVSCNKL